MKFEIEEYVVGEHFLSAIINGDYSGLSFYEEEQMHAWLRTTEDAPGHWSTVDDSRDEFTLCEITRRYSAGETLHRLTEIRPNLIGDPDEKLRV